MKKLLPWLCIIPFGCAALAGCKGGLFSSGPNQDPISIAYSSTPGHYPLILGKEKGFFKEQGITVEAEFNKDYINQINEFRSGKYDGIVVALGSVLSILTTTPDVQIILVINISQGRDAILARHNIQEVEDLKGKVLGTRLGDFGELLVQEMLKKHNVPLDSVKIININAEDLVEKLNKGVIDAGQTWHPYTVQAANYGYHVLFDSTETPGLITEVLVMRRSVIRERPEELKALLRGWLKSREYSLENSDEVRNIIATSLGIDEEYLFDEDAVTFEGIELPTLERNLEIMSPGKTTDSLHFTTQLYTEFFAINGTINAPPDLDTLINPHLLKSLQEDENL
ncbi:MAG: ABC transporter substrate-binding protein [Cyanophyceae cyanobacterium]